PPARCAPSWVRSPVARRSASTSSTPTGLAEPTTHHPGGVCRQPAVVIPLQSVPGPDPPEGPLVPRGVLVFVVARIGKAHGLKGEVTVQTHTDAPEERFTVGTEFVTEPDRGTLVLRSVRLHQQTYLLGFVGVTDRTGAEGLRNTRLLLAEDEAEVE